MTSETSPEAAVKVTEFFLFEFWSLIAGFSIWVVMRPWLHWLSEQVPIQGKYIHLSELFSVNGSKWIARVEKQKPREEGVRVWGTSRWKETEESVKIFEFNVIELGVVTFLLGIDSDNVWDLITTGATPDTKNGIGVYPCRLQCPNYM